MEQIEHNDWQYETLVSWYYIEDTSNYPGPKGKSIPYVKGYKDPTKYEGTELYIPKNTKGYKEYYGPQTYFTDYEGNSVPFKKEYFKLNPRMIKEDTRMQFLAGLITESQYIGKLKENETNSQSPKHITADYSTSGGTSEQKFARVLADNVMAGYIRGTIEGLYSEGEWNTVIKGDPEDFYASMDESIITFKSLPNTFIITAEGMDDEPFTFQVTKTGELEYSAEEM